MSEVVVEKNIEELEEVGPLIEYNRIEYPYGFRHTLNVYSSGIIESGNTQRKIPQSEVKYFENKLLKLNPPSRWAYCFPNTHNFDEISIKLNRGRNSEPIKYEFTNMFKDGAYEEIVEEFEELIRQFF